MLPFRSLAAVSTLVFAALLSAPVAPTATAGSLRIEAAPGSRVEVRLDDRLRPGLKDYVLDGRRFRRTRARAISLRMPGRGRRTKGVARWHRLEVLRTGSSERLASARFAVAGRSSHRAPTLVIFGSPPKRTGSRGARFMFSTTGARATCRLDQAPSRRCARVSTYRSLAVGSHRFTVRAMGRHGSASLTVRWKIVPVRSRTLVFEDDFGGAVLDSGAWDRYYSPGHAGNGLRRPSAIALDGNGNLVITARMVDGQIVSGGMAQRQNLTYGRFEFRVRTEPDPTGTMSGVVLTWPQSENWPIDGENDIYETGTARDSRSPFYSFIHYDATNKQRHHIHDADAAQWHTMRMDWSPSAIKIYRDGTLVWTVTDPEVIPDVAHHLTVQLDATEPRRLAGPVRMYVDYVRIYRYR